MLCSIYTIYASLIQVRLAKALDDDILEEQYAFRKRRSTSIPLACLRRILDLAEATKHHLCITFLDWEEAFDRIDQDKFIEALERMDIPEMFIKAIESLYNNPTFQVNINGNKSDWKKQGAAIRQGCPLSPYLFVILMTVMIRDVHDNLNSKRGTLEHINFNELVYADDTVLITNNTNAMNRLIEKIQYCAGYYGLNFNEKKCISMNFNTKSKTKFADNSFVPTEENTSYLGANINYKHLPNQEINRRIAACMATLTRLNNFWNNNNCPNKFKIQVFDAVIRSKLVYGAESLKVTECMLSRLNAVQIKGLRKILNLEHSYIKRANTNKSIIEKANIFKNPKRLPEKNIMLFSEYVKNKQEALLKHTMRATRLTRPIKTMHL